MTQAEEFLNGDPGAELKGIMEAVEGESRVRVDRLFEDDSVLVIERDKNGNVSANVGPLADYDTTVTETTPRFNAAGDLVNAEVAA